MSKRAKKLIQIISVFFLIVFLGAFTTYSHYTEQYCYAYGDTGYTMNKKWENRKADLQRMMTMIDDGFVPGANLRGRDLRGLDLSDLNLSGADLSYAQIGGTDFSGANLLNAKLVNLKTPRTEPTDHVHFHYDNMEGCGRLPMSSGCSFNERTSECTCKPNESQFYDTNLVGADLTGAHIERAKMHRANLSRTDLTNASFTLSMLIGTNFRGATVNHAQFDGSRLECASFKQVVGDKTYGILSWATHSTLLPSHLYKQFVKISTVQNPRKSLQSEAQSEIRQWDCQRHWRRMRVM